MTVVKKKDVHTLEPNSENPSLTTLSSIHFPESEKSDKDEKIQPPKKPGFLFINSGNNRKQNQTDSQSIENNDMIQNINNLYNINNNNSGILNYQIDRTTMNYENEQIITGIKQDNEEEGYNPDLIRMELMKNEEEKKEEIIEGSLEENKSALQPDRNEGEGEVSKFGFLRKKKVGSDNKREIERRKEESEEVESLSLKENVS